MKRQCSKVLKMKVVVIGNSGQLSTELKGLLDKNTCFLGREDTDITEEKVLHQTLEALSPDVIINAAAYTAVDKAEDEPELCTALNAVAVKNLATYCRLSGCFLVHVSTDYVFNGSKGSPYKTNDAIEPQGVYGKTKAQGEKALLDILPDASCLIRTAWVYSIHGHNFVKTMLRLMEEKPSLSVVDDQIGSPTWAKGLAKLCVEAARNKVSGIYHFTDEGVASWYDFAVAIRDLAISKGLLTTPTPVLPVPSTAYPTPAKRPAYSVLDKQKTRKMFSELSFRHWREQLSDMLDELGQIEGENRE